MDAARSPVLFVALQTGAGANGGIASLGEIMQSLTRYRPIVLTNSESAATRRWRDLGIEVHIVRESASPGWRRAPFASAMTYVRYFLAVLRLLRRSGARTVHANDPLAFQLAYAAARARPGTRIALNIRDTIGSGRPPPGQKYRRLFAAADHTFFLSRDMIERWRAVAPNAPDKASASYSVVDFDRFRPRPLSREMPRVVLVSGLICAKKGQLEFLEHVAPSLAKAGLECWFAGDDGPGEGGYAERCRAAAEPIRNSVRFLGLRGDIAELIARAHVVAVPSRYEGLMRTMIEAVACGRPVVSTEVASAREVLLQPGREAGAVVAAADEEMARQIVRLCEDEEENRRLGGNGIRIAHALFDRAGVVENYERQYDALACVGA